MFYVLCFMFYVLCFMFYVFHFANSLIINEIPPPEKSGRGIYIPLLCKIAHYFADMLSQM